MTKLVLDAEENIVGKEKISTCVLKSFLSRGI